MQRKFINILILFLIIFFLINCRKAYDINFETLEYDFGEVIAESEVKYTFVFKNTGIKKLNINIVPTCGCTTTSGWDREVAAGKEGKIPITFVTPRSNGEHNKIIFVKTNIPEQPSIKLIVKGRTIIPIEVVPLSAWLGDVNTGTQYLKGVITITNNLDYPLKILEIIPPDDKVTYSLSTIEKNKKYKIDYIIHPPFDGEKTVNKELIIKTNNKKYEFVQHKFSYFIQ